MIKVLDYGFVELRNISGPIRRSVEVGPAELLTPRDWDADDIDPAQAARMSFSQFDSTRTREQDLALCEYLMRNKHTSPFEMIEVWLEMKMPIFVARQFVRHRTVSINEVSGRYVKLPDEWYIPKFEDIGFKPPRAKQGREIRTELTESEIEKIGDFQQTLDGQCRAAYANYEYYLDAGIAPELARMFLHLNHYTHWLWKQDLHNLMHFLSLRDHSHAQAESQAYAKAIDKLIRAVLPESMALYDKYRRLA